MARIARSLCENNGFPVWHGRADLLKAQNIVRIDMEFS